MSVRVLDLIDICQGCAHHKLANPKDMSKLGRCPICGVPTPSVDAKHTCGTSAADSWGDSGGHGAPFRDPYLAKTSMHLCHGCDRIVQDERAWKLRKSGVGIMRCRVCDMPVPAECTLPLDGLTKEDGLLADPLPPLPPAGDTRTYEEALIHQVRSGSAGAAALLGERHRKVRDGEKHSRVADVLSASGKHFCGVDAWVDDSVDQGRTPPAAAAADAGSQSGEAQTPASGGGGLAR